MYITVYNYYIRQFEYILTYITVKLHWSMGCSSNLKKI